MKGLVKPGKLVATTRAVVARSGLGVAIRKGAAKPAATALLKYLGSPFAARVMRANGLEPPG